MKLSTVGLCAFVGLAGCGVHSKKHAAPGEEPVVIGKEVRTSEGGEKKSEGGQEHKTEVSGAVTPLKPEIKPETPKTDVIPPTTNVVRTEGRNLDVVDTVPQSCDEPNKIVFARSENKFHICTDKKYVAIVNEPRATTNNSGKEYVFVGSTGFTMFANGKANDTPNLLQPKARDVSQNDEFTAGDTTTNSNPYIEGIQGCVPLEAAGLSHSGPGKTDMYRHLTDEVFDVVSREATTAPFTRRPLGFCLREVRVLELRDDRILVRLEVVPDARIIGMITDGTTPDSAAEMQALAVQELSFKLVYMLTKTVDKHYKLDYNFTAPSLMTEFSRSAATQTTAVNVVATADLDLADETQPRLRIAMRTNIGDAGARRDVSGEIDMIGGHALSPKLDGLQDASYLKNPAPALFVLEQPATEPNWEQLRESFTADCVAAYSSRFESMGAIRADNPPPAETLLTLEIVRSRIKNNGSLDLSDDIFILGAQRYCQNIFTALSKVTTLNLMNGGDVSLDSSNPTGGIWRPIKADEQADPFQLRTSRRLVDHDLDPATLPRLRVKNISILKHFPKLKVLILKDNEVSDIAALAGLKELTLLDLSRRLVGVAEAAQQVYDLEAVRGLSKLGRLDLTNQRVATATGLAPLSRLFQLRQLDVNLTNDGYHHNGLLADALVPEANHLASLAGLENLELLKLNGLATTAVHDFRPLASLKRLRVVGISPAFENPQYIGNDQVVSWDKALNVAFMYSQHPQDPAGLFQVNLQTDIDGRD